MGVQEDQIGVPLSRAVFRDHLVPGISQKLREEVPKIGVVRALRAGEVQGKPAAQGVEVRSRGPRHVLGESTLSRAGGARGDPEPWYPGGVKKAPVATSKTRVKTRKTLAVGRKSSARRPDSFSEAKLLLEEVIEENLETFKLLARY